MVSWRGLLGRLSGRQRDNGTHSGTHPGSPSGTHPGSPSGAHPGKHPGTPASRNRRQRKALGEGVWLRIVTRNERALDRFHQVLDRAPVGPTQNALIEAGNRLVDVHEGLFAVCLYGQEVAPSEGFHVPPGPGGVALLLHRRASALPTLVAQAAEAALFTSTALARGDDADAATSLAAVLRTVERTEEGLAEARRARAA